MTRKQPRPAQPDKLHSGSGKTNNDTRWQWDDSQWGDSPTAPRTPEQVPDRDDRDGHTAAVRRLLRWASR